MKKMEALFAEIVGSEELKAKYEDAVKANKTQEFLKENGCDVSLESWAEYMQSLLGEDSMSMDDMDAVAGGTGAEKPWGEVILAGADVVLGAGDVIPISLNPAILLSSVRRAIDFAS